MSFQKGDLVMYDDPTGREIVPGDLGIIIRRHRGNRERGSNWWFVYWQKLGKTKYVHYRRFIKAEKNGSPLWSSGM
jgi:hypothetical protein